MDEMHIDWWRDYWAARPGGDWPGEDAPDADVDRLYRRQARVVECLIDTHPVRRILELGCANGLLYEQLRFPDAEYWGVDFRASKIEEFRHRHPALQLAAVDAASFRANQQFDVIFSVSLLHYFTPAMARQHLANAHAMLPAGGVLLMTDFRWRSNRIRQLLGDVLALGRRSIAGERNGGLELAAMRHMSSFSRRRLSDYARRAGFSAEFFGSLPVPGYLTVRMTKQPVSAARVAK